ncbi:MAG: flippase [Nanoarchaeota archaeon]|nr:flippase [Nanoarchaeota archaeon]
MNYAKKVLSGTVSVFVISLLAAFLGYFVRLVLARGLAKDDYGIFYAVFSLFSLLLMFTNFGQTLAITKFIPDYLHKKDYSGVKSVIVTGFLIQFIFSTLIGFLTIIFSDQIAVHLFHASSASIVIKMLGGMFILMPLENVFMYSFQGFQKMLYYSGVVLVRMLIISILILIFFWLGLGLESPSLAYLVVYLIIPIVCFPFFIKTFPEFFKAKLAISIKLVKKMLRFGIPVMIGAFGFVLMTYTDTIILTYYRTMGEVALYQVASPTARVAMYLSYALAAVFLPLSAELWAKGEKKKLKTAMDLLYRYSFMAVIPLALMMILFPELILKILFGPQYTEAALAMQILSLGTIFYTIAHININVLSGIGKPKESTKILLFAAIFNLIANMIFIPYYGILGAALSTLASWIIILFFTLYHIRSYIQSSAPWKEWILNIIAGAGFVLVVSLLKNLLVMNIWAELIISVGAASVAYLLLIILFRLITKEDVNFFMYSIGQKPFFNKQGQDKV